MTQTILIVDDDLILREYLAMILKAQGYHAVQVANGLEALGVLTQGTPQIDLVLLDLIMPVMDGPALLQELSRLEVQTPIIVISAYLESLGGQTGPRVVGSIAKPLHARDLVALVKKVLEGDEA